ncbi:hypothetical protein FOVG_12764 [Fusarium oxysporum f. sp. pisi HDV247]|uniref:Uncharacterized protein n=1 Tax=Fusarium oxysporum f. sp. pisi HDV247 TaxID=1080344 RepID=W9P1P4_FUSOX|nr:hypothetical protein FOVG_12764 [Fusarium oxysporum f. sp. pisi HDV247]
MGATTAKKLQEWSEWWNEDFRHYYYAKMKNGYLPSLCRFTSKYAGKYEVDFDNVKETLHIILPKDDYYHKGLNAQKAIRRELEAAMTKYMPGYWVKDEARHRERDDHFSKSVEEHYQKQEAKVQR